MAEAKFKMGDRVKHSVNSNMLRTVVVADPDPFGNIVVSVDTGPHTCGAYVVNSQADYELVPTRYVVEMRPPMTGEQYISGACVFTADCDDGDIRPVIIEEQTDAG